MPRKTVNGLNGPHILKHSSFKKKKNIPNESAKLKRMIAMMNPTQAEQASTSSGPSSSSPSSHNGEDFLSTGRTGRRNALPDILSDHSMVTSSELPIQLESLSTKDNEVDPNRPSTSKQPDNVR